MKAVSLLTVALALSACASGGVRSSAASAAAATAPDTLETVKARVLELQRQAAMHEVELGRLRQQVAALEARLGGAARPPVPAATPARPISAEDGTGPIERAAPVAGEDLPPSSPAVPVPPVPAAARAGSEAQALYDQAYSAYQERRYAESEGLFTRFLGSYAGTDLADNAQYWIGETRYARGDHAGALAAFRETIERYPEGNKLADALLKSADCLAALGDLPAARSAYQEVIRRFPGTSSAATAEERRSRLH